MNEKQQGRGIVLKVYPKKKYVLLLTPDREVKNVPYYTTPLPRVGEEIEYSFSSLSPTGRGRSRVLALSAVAAVLLLFFGISYWWVQYQQVVTQVAVDINPSLEFHLNRNEQIIKADAFNEKGEKLLSETGSLKNNTWEEGFTRVFARAQKMNYINKDINNTLVISMLHKSDSGEGEDKISSRVQSHLEETLQEASLDYDLWFNEISEKALDPDIINEAKREKLNANRMILMQACRETDTSYSASEIKEKSAALVAEKLREKSKELPPDINIGPPETPPGQEDTPPGHENGPPGQEKRPEERETPPGQEDIPPAHRNGPEDREKENAEDKEVNNADINNNTGTDKEGEEKIDEHRTPEGQEPPGQMPDREVQEEKPKPGDEEEPPGHKEDHPPELDESPREKDNEQKNPEAPGQRQQKDKDEDKDDKDEDKDEGKESDNNNVPGKKPNGTPPGQENNPRKPDSS